MAVNEAEILNFLTSQTSLGTKGSSGLTSEDLYEQVILDLGNDLVDRFRETIEENTRSDNGALKASVKPILSSNGFEIEADYYYKFIDEGVSGVGGDISKPLRSIVSTSPYKFKNLYVPSLMVNSIREWSGASIEQSYAIAVNIKRYGIQPKNITEQTLTDAVLERISEDLATITGLAVEVVFKQATKQ